MARGLEKGTFHSVHNSGPCRGAWFPVETGGAGRLRTVGDKHLIHNLLPFLGKRKGEKGFAESIWFFARKEQHRTAQLIPSVFDGWFGRSWLAP